MAWENCSRRLLSENCDSFFRCAASILAARKLLQYDGGTRVPATVSAIADSIRWGGKTCDGSTSGGRRSPEYNRDKHPPEIRRFKTTFAI